MKSKRITKDMIWYLWNGLCVWRVTVIRQMMIGRWSANGRKKVKQLFTWKSLSTQHQRSTFYTEPSGMYFAYPEWYCNRKYPPEKHNKLESREISFDHKSSSFPLVLKLHKSTAFSLPCCIQNFKPAGILRNKNSNRNMRFLWSSRLFLGISYYIHIYIYIILQQ